MIACLIKDRHRSCRKNQRRDPILVRGHHFPLATILNTSASSSFSEGRFNGAFPKSKVSTVPHNQFPSPQTDYAIADTSDAKHPNVAPLQLAIFSTNNQSASRSLQTNGSGVCLVRFKSILPIPVLQDCLSHTRQTNSTGSGHIHRQPPGIGVRIHVFILVRLLRPQETNSLKPLSLKAVVDREA